MACTPHPSPAATTLALLLVSGCASAHSLQPESLQGCYYVQWLSLDHPPLEDSLFLFTARHDRLFDPGDAPTGYLAVPYSLGCTLPDCIESASLLRWQLADNQILLTRESANLMMRLRPRGADLVGLAETLLPVAPRQWELRLVHRSCTKAPGQAI